MDCPVCLERYDLQRRRPKVLVPCGHSVCRECLLDPGFGTVCPQDRQPFVGEPDNLPDCMAVINLITTGGSQQRPAVWCCDCEKEFSADCADAGHAARSQRQLRAERLDARLQPLGRGLAACAVLGVHADAAAQELLEQCAEYRRQLQRRLAAVRAEAGLGRAADAAEPLLPLAERLTEAASLAGLRGQCSVVLRAEDGAEWRASVDLGQRRALRHALMQLLADGDLTKDSRASSAMVLTVRASESRNLDLSGKRTAEMTAGQKVQLLLDSNLEEVRSLTGVDCSEDSAFLELLLLAVAPQLEVLEMKHPLQEHMEALAAMLSLRTLTVAFNKEAGIPVAVVPHLPRTLRELSLSVHDLEQWEMVKDLSSLVSLRKLQLDCFVNVEDETLELPRQLEELSIGWFNDAFLSALQHLPRLRRLFVDTVSLSNFCLDFSILQPKSGHGSLTWLKLGSAGFNHAIFDALFRAHADTLQEIQMLSSSEIWKYYDDDDYTEHPEGLSDCLRQCKMVSLRRLVLLRSLDGKYEVEHTAESCRQQVWELEDALQCEDVAVLCNVCDKDLEL